jgi:hypothetical protein
MELDLFSQLDLNDLKHLRLTCKTLANDAVSLVLSHIGISSKETKTIEEVVSDLQFLAKAAGNCPREITIHEISSIFRDSSPEAGCNINKANVTVNVAHDHVKRISQVFLTALTSFKIVRTVKYATLLCGR